MNLNDPRIESYLNQEMSEVDAQNFEREAKENPEVWDHIQFQQFMIQGIREEGAAELKDFIANRITEEVEDDFTSRNIWWSVAATLIILAVGLGVTYKFQWLDGEAKTVVAKNDVNQGSEKSALQKLEPQLNESDESKSAAVDTFLMPEIIADNEESSDAMVEAPMNEDVYASPLKDDARSDRGRQMDGLDRDKEIRSVNVTPFIVSAIELNSNPRSKVAVAESKAENSKPNAKRKMESSILSDTIVGYAGKSRVAQNAEGTKQFLITLSEQSGITKPQVFMGGQANGKINLTLWNAGTSDILIFHLGDEYYLQLGNDFYYLPLIPGSTANLKPVADRAILEKLKQ